MSSQKGGAGLPFGGESQIILDFLFEGLIGDPFDIPVFPFIAYINIR